MTQCFCARRCTIIVMLRRLTPFTRLVWKFCSFQISKEVQQTALCLTILVTNCYILDNASKKGLVFLQRSVILMVDKKSFSPMVLSRPRTLTADRKASSLMGRLSGYQCKMSYRDVYGIVTLILIFKSSIRSFDQSQLLKNSTKFSECSTKPNCGHKIIKQFRAKFRPILIVLSEKSDQSQHAARKKFDHPQL